MQGNLKIVKLAKLTLHVTHHLKTPYSPLSGAHSLWEFPILTLKYGGVAFIVVYLVMYLLLGAPMLLLEMTLGQYAALTPTKLFRNICPVSLT